MLGGKWLRRVTQRPKTLGNHTMRPILPKISAILPLAKPPKETSGKGSLAINLPTMPSHHLIMETPKAGRIPWECWPRPPQRCTAPAESCLSEGDVIFVHALLLWCSPSSSVSSSRVSWGKVFSPQNTSLAWPPSSGEPQEVSSSALCSRPEGGNGNFTRQR